MANILSGLTVIDITQNVAGPFCSQMLGDLGATVIFVYTQSHPYFFSTISKMPTLLN